MDNPEHIRRAFNAAIDFALDDCAREGGPAEGIDFLRCWREGDWRTIADDWPEFDLSTIGVALPKSTEVAHA